MKCRKQIVLCSIGQATHKLVWPGFSYFVKKQYIFFLLVFAWQHEVKCQVSSCIVKNSRQFFYLNNDTIRILHQLQTSDGGQLLVGKTTATGLNKSDGLLIKTNGSATILWSKRINDTQPFESLSFNIAIEAADGNYIIGGYTSLQIQSPTFAYYLLKCDPAGNTLWQQEYPVNNIIGQWNNINLTGLVESADKEIFVSGVLNGSVAFQPASQFALILKTSDAGQLKYSKLFYENSVDLNSFIGIFPEAGNLLVWGYCEDAANTQADGRRIYWMRLDKNGDNFQIGDATCFAPVPQSASSYNISPHLFKAFKTDNGYSIAGLLAENTAVRRAVAYLNFDDNLALKRSWMLPQVTGVIVANAGDFNVAKDGSFLLAQRSNSQNTQIYVSQYDSTGVVIVQKQIDGFGTGTGVNTVNGGIRIGVQNNNFLFSTNYLDNLRPVFELLQFAPYINNQVCFGKQTKFGSAQEFQTYPLPTTHFNNLDNIVSVQPGSLSTSSVTVGSAPICSATVVCNSITLSGADTVCILGQPAFYTAHRDPSCTFPVKWVFDSAHCSGFTILTDSTISITWKTTVQGKQTVKLIGILDNCSGITDTLSVLLVPFLKPFQRDTSLCTGDSIRLSPGNWFKSYVWQDGSTDSVYVAHAPGLYIVTYQTYCGRTISDSVNISQVYVNLLDNDSDNICIGDSLVLQAKPGFSGYQWEPNYYQQPLTENVVAVFPLIDTIYIVSAIVPPGCRIYDSIRITTHNPQVIKITISSQECDEAVLSVQTTVDLSQILWSGTTTNETGNKIKVTKSGLYQLSAIDINGCRIKDSLSLILDPCTTQINFPNAFTPNRDGLNDMFRPVAKGHIMEYEMTIYNRLGQRVFYSNIPSVGWDGKISGLSQPASTFVWYCKYRFEGEQTFIRKGTITLVR